MIMCNIKCSFLSIVLWPAIWVQAQGTYSFDAVLDSLTEPKLFGDLYKSPLPKSSVGSQFFIDDWLYGDIYLSNNNIVKNKVLKYNAYLDMLIWNPLIDYQEVKLDKDQIEAFSLHGQSGESYYFQKIPVKPDLASDSVVVFGEVLYLNRISLFAYRKVVVADHEVGVTDYYRDVYKVNTLYIFRLENGKTLGFRRHKKRDILTLFPGKKEMIIAKLRELKQHRFRTEADLINITKVLNEVL